MATTPASCWIVQEREAAAAGQPAQAAAREDIAEHARSGYRWGRSWRQPKTQRGSQL